MSTINFGNKKIYANLKVGETELTPTTLQNRLKIGIYEYDSEYEYKLNELCFYDGHIYKSIISGNIGNSLQNQLKWQEFKSGSGSGSTSSISLSIQGQNLIASGNDITVNNQNLTFNI